MCVLELREGEKERERALIFSGETIFAALKKAKKEVYTN